MCGQASALATRHVLASWPSPRRPSFGPQMTSWLQNVARLTARSGRGALNAQRAVAVVRVEVPSLTRKPSTAVICIGRSEKITACGVCARGDLYLHQKAEGACA